MTRGLRSFAILFVPLLVGTWAAACGGGGNSSGFAPGGGEDASTDGTNPVDSGRSDSGNFITGDGSGSSSGGNVDAAAGFDVLPSTLQTVTVMLGKPIPTVSFTAYENGVPVNAGWSVDAGNLASIGAGPSSAGVVTPTGNAGGLVTITAGRNGTTVQRQVFILIVGSQNGVNPGAPGEASQTATSVGQLTSGGGIGGVGGEGLGPKVTDQPTLNALATPTGGAGGLSYLYPYDKTVWPRGILAPLLQWTWPTGDADAIAIKLATSSGSFTYTGIFGRPAVLAMESPVGKYVRAPIPQDVWAMATETAGGKTPNGKPDLLTVSLTVAKGGVGYGPISETWTVAPALLDGTIYYNSYGTLLVQNSTGAVGGNGMFGAAVLSIHVGDTGPKVVAGTTTDCRTCHSAAAFGSRLEAMPYGNYSAYDLTPSGSVEHVMPNSGPWFPALYPDGSKMLAADGNLYPLPNGGASLPVSGLPADPETPAFSPDGTLIAFNSGVGAKLTVMSFDNGTGAFSNAVTVADDTSNAGLTPAWPAFFPDSKSIVFHHQSDPGHDGAGSDPCTRGGATAQIAWTNLAGAASVTALDQLNGKGYLPKMATAVPLACSADGIAVGSGTPYSDMDLDHSNDVNHNYEPTVAPVPAGGYAWVVFTSRRMYGSVADIPPFCSDPRGVDLVSNITPKKLWVAAVDLNAAPGTDPSHPAFYLPGQELLAGNSRGFWVLDPCRPDGASCTAGDQCCNGYCTQGDAGLACGMKPPNATCSQQGDKCVTSADCCSTMDSCIGGFCEQNTAQ
jgi:hypothetical protein